MKSKVLISHDYQQYLRIHVPKEIETNEQVSNLIADALVDYIGWPVIVDIDSDVVTIILDTDDKQHEKERVFTFESNAYYWLGELQREAKCARDLYLEISEGIENLSILVDDDMPGIGFIDLEDPKELNNLIVAFRRDLQSIDKLQHSLSRKFDALVEVFRNRRMN